MKDSKTESKQCLVIGAGISGLIAAKLLHAHGVPTAVLDKGRSVGGRMATRRAGLAVFDHGAQFFTARDPWFLDQVTQWLQEGAADRWSRGFPTSPESYEPDGHWRYRGARGMTSIPKHVSRGLDILTGQRVAELAPDGERWLVRTESAERFGTDILLLTAPVPQSLALLDAGGAALPHPRREELEAIRYDPCIAVLVQPRASRVPTPGAMQLGGEPLAWIGDNRMKGISETNAVTLHAGPEYSRSRWGAHDHEVTADLIDAARQWIDGPFEDIQVHRWRFAKPSNPSPSSCLAVADPLPVVFAGDAFGDARIEGAALSGRSAAHKVLEWMGLVDDPRPES